MHRSGKAKRFVGLTVVAASVGVSAVGVSSPLSSPAPASQVAPIPTIPLLTAEQARDPVQVVQALHARRDKNPHAATAELYFKHGAAAQDRQDWGLAAKAFGEAIIRTPSTQFLLAHGHAQLRSLGMVRAREGNVAQEAKEDVAYSLGFYRSATAADEAFKDLNPTERETLAQHTTCLADFLEQSVVASTCQPVSQYLAGR